MSLTRAEEAAVARQRWRDWHGYSPDAPKSDYSTDQPWDCYVLSVRSTVAALEAQGFEVRRREITLEEMLA
jgi:hypothetical protein